VKGAVKKVRIAQLSPLFESVPPSLYGGTERVVSYLTEELVKAGHEVALFASGDSVTAAELVPCSERALRLDERQLDPVSLHLIMMEEVLRRQFDFDIIHSHIDGIGFVLGRRTEVPVVNTLHGRLDRVEHDYIFREYAGSPVISISNAQRRPQPSANWVSTVYHGLPPALYRSTPRGGGFLVYIGRVSPEKKVDSCVNIAALSGIPLKIAAKVDNADREYFEQCIKPLLDNPLVEFLGEVNDREKEELLCSALAFLHPVDWPEPFGLSMLEAMACGLPVVTTRVGGNEQVVTDPRLGELVEWWNPDKFREAIDRALGDVWDVVAIIAHARSNTWDERISRLVAEFKSIQIHDCSHERR
jgi:glycosyltransferase involved in cell wall biosynthesis